MIGKKLSCQIHAVTSTPASIKNLECLIERCFLRVKSIVPTSFASAVAATTKDEQKLGVTCIDIGADAAHIAMIYDGQFMHTDTITVGGMALTHDIAKVLSIPLTEAEKLKILHGSVLYHNKAKSINIPQLALIPDDRKGTGSFQRDQPEMSLVDLSDILYLRARRQLEFIKDRMEKNIIKHEFAQSIVLTGGASQLKGLHKLANEVFECPVRIGCPPALQELLSEYQGPALSTVVGLSAVNEESVEMMYLNNASRPLKELYVNRVEQWLRESF